MDYESADRWNQLHAVGTPVSVRLLDGASFEAKTAARAQQWGSYAIVALEGRPGMWTTSAMTVLELQHVAVQSPPRADETGRSEPHAALGQ